MNRFDGTDVRKLIKEVLQEGWMDYIFSPSTKKSKVTKLYNVYNDLDKWENDMLDIHNNLYLGPELRTDSFHFKKGKPVDATGSKRLLYKVMEWNESLAEKYSIPWSEVRNANEKILNRYIEDYPEILGAA